ncbi:MAG: NAD(P)H-dependent oxidoreductase [Spirochaetales bacterium]|nr:NAD(P)H-dependent oxidoreductase [Spirochaetales bacterium]
MKVTAFIGSARKKYCWQAARTMRDKLQAMGNVECEIVRLSDYNLQICRGCILCMEKGEQYCPLRDDRDILIEKMRNSDGIIFAVPNYTFQVSGLMKVFLDRLAFICHRPEFFGKTFSGIVAQGICGGKKIAHYLDYAANPQGFNVVKSSCIMTLEPMTEKGQKKNDLLIDRQSRAFFRQLVKNEYRKPTLFEMLMFRMARTRIKMMLDESYRDYTYYRDKGWFESEFYYPVKIGIFKRIFGNMIDRIMTKSLTKKPDRQTEKKPAGITAV